MKALVITFKMRVIRNGLSYLSGDEFKSAGPFMHPQCAFNRPSMRHLVRRPRLNSNQITMIDSLNECPNLTLQWTATHLEHMAYSPSEGASKSKSSPTDAREIDTDDGTRSQQSDAI